MKIRICLNCKQEKFLNNFFKNKTTKDGLSYWCKKCCSEYHKEYRRHNKEKLKENMKKYHQKNKEKMNAVCKEYYYKNQERMQEYRQKNRKKKSEYMKKYLQKYNQRTETKERRNELAKIKRQTDFQYQLNNNISNAIRKGLNRNKAGYHWENLVGYTLQDLKLHLENQFDKNMSWDNYGSYWHIDHIVPKSWFNYNNISDKEFKECWALNNLQPLEKNRNMLKKDNVNIQELIKYCFLMIKIN